MNDDPQRVFVRREYPDEDEPIESPFVNGADLDNHAGAHLMTHEWRYRKDSNSIGLLGAYLTAYREGIHPPEWVQDRLAAILETYFAAGGDKSLDECFGLKVTRGKRPPLKSWIADHSKEAALYNMWRLITFFGITISQAAEMESWRLGESGRISLDTVTLYDYYRKWEKPDDDLTNQIKAEFEAMSDEDRKAELTSIYPIEVWPQGLKSRFRTR